MLEMIPDSNPELKNTQQYILEAGTGAYLTICARLLIKTPIT